jgi:hypothetical protein
MTNSVARWRLYVREGCHLCAQAEAGLYERGVIDYQRIDIDRDLELSIRYGLSVPVLERVRDGRAWSAPWDWDELASVLAEPG